MSHSDDGIKDEAVRQSLVLAARKIFEERFGRNGELETELANIEKRPFGAQQHLLELKAKIKAKGIFAKRLRDFASLSGSEFRCPKCWLMDEVAFSLSERHVGHYRFSFDFDLHCSRCGQTFRV